MSDLDKLAEAARGSMKRPLIVERDDAAAKWIIVVAAAAVVMILFGVLVQKALELQKPVYVFTSKPAPEFEQPVPVIREDAVYLASVYVQNGVLGDQEYSRKLLAVSGRIRSIDVGITGAPYVCLQGAAMTDVQCMFDGSWKPRLAGLRLGQAITIRGECRGKFMNVLMSNCTIEQID